MSLFFDLRVTDGPTPSSLGLLEVQRTSHTDVSNPGSDTECQYTVRLDGREIGTVSHRYGAGPWALAGLAAALAGQFPEAGFRRRWMLGLGQDAPS